MDWISDYKTRYSCKPSSHRGIGAAMTIFDAIGPCEEEGMPSKKGGGHCFSGLTYNEHIGRVEVRYIYDYKYDKPF